MRKMKEMRRLCVYIVYEPPQTPQDIVDKRMIPGRMAVENCKLCKNGFAEKSLENKAFFWYDRNALKIVIHKLSTFLHI